MIRRFLAALSLCFFSTLAAAQTNVPLYSAGPVTAGHALRLLQSGVVGDAGGAAGATIPGQGYLTEIGITNTGTPSCINDALINAVGGYHQLCFGANALGGGLISYNAYGGASALGLNFNINGQTYGFPGPGNGNVIGPVSSAIHHVVTFNSSAGTTIADPSGTFPTIGSTPYQNAQINVGGFPSNGFTNGGVYEGFVSALTVPNSYTQEPAPNTGFSAYIENKNSVVGSSAVGYFATSVVDVSGGALAGGFNAVVCNATPANCQSATAGSGVNYGDLDGIEIDINNLETASSQAIGQVSGVFLTGLSQDTPTLGAYGVHIAAIGTGVGWSAGIQSDTGATGAALQMGAQVSGNSQNSQDVVYISTSSSGATYVAEDFEDYNGNRTFGALRSGNAGGFIFNGPTLNFATLDLFGWIAGTYQTNVAYNGSGGSAIPACVSGLAGTTAMVSDGKTSPTYLSAYAAADGAATRKVHCPGSGGSWLYD